MTPACDPYQSNATVVIYIHLLGTRYYVLCITQQLLIMIEHVESHKPTQHASEAYAAPVILLAFATLSMQIAACRMQPALQTPKVL